MSRRQTRLTPAEGGRFASPVGSPVPPTAGDLAGMRGDPPPVPWVKTTPGGYRTGELADKIARLAGQNPLPPTMLPLVDEQPAPVTRRCPVRSGLTPAEPSTPISGRFPNDADVIAARALQLAPRYPGYGLAVLRNTGANGGVNIRVALAGRALDHILPQWELEASGAENIDVDAIVGKLACHLDQMTGGHAQPVGGPTPESVAASIRASIHAPNAVSERRYVEVVERPAKPTETLWRLVDSAGRRALAGYPGAKDMVIYQQDMTDMGCTISVFDGQTDETTTRALRVHPDSIKGYEPGGDVLVETDQLGSIAADWNALLSHAVARRKAKQATESGAAHSIGRQAGKTMSNLGGPTPEQVGQSMADRSCRRGVDPTPPAASATQIAEAAQRQVLSKACVRANRFHPHLHFAAEPDPRVAGWRVHASDVDHTRHIVITGRDLLVEPTEAIDRRLDALAGLFPVPPPSEA